MKPVFLSILLVLTGATCFAQTDSIKVWNKWCARADTALLFPTANNLIQIYSAGIKPTDLAIKSLDNALKLGTPEIKGDTLSVMAMPYPKYGKRMRLTITNKRTQKLLKTVQFSAGEIPVPVARLGSITSATEAKKKDILDQSFLRVVFANSLYNYPYRIKEYTFKSRMAGRDINIPVKGFFITNEVLTVLSNAPTGAFIEFTGIQATCPECNPRTLTDLKMFVR